MLNIYTVSLFGHRRLSNAIAAEKALEQIVRDLISSKEYVEFLIGRSGDFDILAASVIRRVQREQDRANSSLILVLPYLAAEYKNDPASFNNYYNETEICERSANVHFKTAIQVRNQYMVNLSDLLICCIEHNNGGAYQTVKYAQKQDVPIINIAQ